jgi:anti-sigma factor RsiW
MTPLGERCPAIRRELAWFVGGDLEPGQMAAVAGHLAACPACRREAASLQQARKALGGAGAASRRPGALAGVDEAMFAALQEQITAAAFAAAAVPVRRSALARALCAAAAVLLFGFGWWLVRGPAPEPLLVRAPIAGTGAAGSSTPLVLPWAGPRARMQPLGYSVSGAPDGDEDGFGAGMLRRQRLRTLVEDLPTPGLPRRE